LQDDRKSTQRERKSTQRQRLLDGVVHIAAQEGYPAMTVSLVIAHAGVSRPTFYDYFTDKQDALLAAVTAIQDELLSEVKQAVARQVPGRALASSIDALVVFAATQQPKARVLMNETLAAGAAALELRDRGIAQIAAAVERSLGKALPGAPVPDLPLAAVIGAVQRLLVSRLRRDGRAAGEMSREILDWINGYTRPKRSQRRRTLTPAAPPQPSPFVASMPLRAPPARPPGRPRVSVSREEVTENHRQRMIFATAQTVVERGYAATTVADILKRTGIDGRVFYRHFDNKQDMFMATYELACQTTITVTASAFFAGSSWPERVWEAGRAFTQHLERNPLLTRIAVIESGALDGNPERLQRLSNTFTVFLQEGYQYASPDPAPSQLALEAIAATNFEIVYLQARKGTDFELSGLLGHLAYICLAPFLGAVQANHFIEKKVSAV